MRARHRRLHRLASADGALATSVLWELAPQVTLAAQLEANQFSCQFCGLADPSDVGQKL